MSSGGNLPYQLRPNKAVERLLFLDALKRLDPVLGISRRYRYVGFGGPQMEDFRLLNEQFPRMRMVSLEAEPEIVKRQKFNGPHTNITYKLQNASDFVTDFSPLQKTIVWLDYTAPSQRRRQVEDFQNLLRRIRNLSIVKITMNASAVSLGGTPGHELHTQRLDKFREFSRFFPNGQIEQDIHQKHFAVTLLRAIEFAASEVLQDRSEWRAQPITSAVYADGQSMLTVTCLVGERTAIDSVVRRSKLSEWDFARLSWNNPVAINVPELTLKERICINQLLPRYGSDVEFMHRKLRCCIDSDPEESERKLQNYAIFHRHYPHFGKVAI